MSKADQQEQYKSLKQWAIQHLNKHKSLSLYKGFRTYEDGSTFEIAGRPSPFCVDTTADKKRRQTEEQGHDPPPGGGYVAR